MTETSPRLRNAWVICWVSLGAILVCQVGDRLMVTGSYNISWKRPFDAAIWADREHGDFHDNRRWIMVSDLQRSHLKLGMKRSEVLRLLGTDGAQKNTLTLWYSVGDDGEYPVNFEIDFDSHERFVRSKLVDEYH